MNLIEICYIIYLLIGIPLTLWVGQTLHRNGLAHPGPSEIR